MENRIFCLLTTSLLKHLARFAASS